MGIYFEEEPLLKPFEELTGKEAKAYFEWFLSYIPKANEQIKHEIDNYLKEDWKPDFSLASIEVISKWLYDTTYYREISVEEIDEEIRICNYPTHIADAVKSYRKRTPVEVAWRHRCTGIYFGEMLKNNVSGILEWKYIKKPKSDIYFHQPVLVRKDVAIDKYPAYGIISNTTSQMLRQKDPLGILNRYKHWERLLTDGSGFVFDSFYNKTPDELKKHLKSIPY